MLKGKGIMYYPPLAVQSVFVGIPVLQDNGNNGIYSKSASRPDNYNMNSLKFSNTNNKQINKQTKRGEKEEKKKEKNPTYNRLLCGDFHLPQNIYGLSAHGLFENQKLIQFEEIAIL
jgi:hypothetical protein